MIHSDNHFQIFIFYNFIIVFELKLKINEIILGKIFTYYLF